MKKLLLCFLMSASAFARISPGNIMDEGTKLTLRKDIAVTELFTYDDNELNGDSYYYWNVQCFSDTKVIGIDRPYRDCAFSKRCRISFESSKSVILKKGQNLRVERLISERQVLPNLIMGTGAWSVVSYELSSQDLDFPATLSCVNDNYFHMSKNQLTQILSQFFTVDE